MIGNEVEPATTAGSPFRNPWPPLITALIATLAALASAKLVGWGWLPFLLAAIGVLAAGVAVAIRPGSAAVLGLAALTALIASTVGPRQEWDSARLVLRVLTMVGAAGAVLVLCPTTARRAVVSVLIVVHFGGILSAVISPDGSWLANQAWYHFYRPYLQFMYLNNAYRFYSPEPGPASLLWFCVKYEPDADGSQNLRWVKVPALDKDGNHIRPDDTPLWPNVEFTRRLSMAESANFPGPSLLTMPGAELLLRAREDEATRRGLPSLALLQGVPLDIQYREPNDLSKKWIAGYARHVAHNYPHQDPAKKDRQVVSVKVYKVLHMILTPAQLLAGLEADDPTLYYAYYMGEFDPDGDMLPECQTLEWDANVQRWEVARSTDGHFRRDGLLYWWIPIIRLNVDPKSPPAVQLQQKPTNFVAKHAGDVDGGDLP